MKRHRRGSAMIEVGLCLAVFAPIVFAGVRIAYGANQMHEVEEAVAEAAQAGGACATEAEIRQIALRDGRLPGVKPEDVTIVIDRESAQPTISVSIRNYHVVRIASVQALTYAPSASFPYACEE